MESVNSICSLTFLSPDQTDSQVDASWKLESTCDSVWPGLGCTCVDLGWLALILVEIKCAHKSRQVFHRLATQPKSTHSLTINGLLANEIQDMSALKWFFATREYLWGNLPVRLVTQRKSLRKFNLPLLPTTCRSVWPGFETRKKFQRNHLYALVPQVSLISETLCPIIFLAVFQILRLLE